jgi:hypothetical protein
VADYTSIAHRQAALIRKALQGSVFIAPYTASAITSITTGASQDIAPLPAGYTDVGMIDKKSAPSWANKVTTQEVNAWGDAYAVRRDITKVDGSLKFTMLETNKTALQLYLGQDLSTAPLAPTTRELIINQASRPQPIPYRVLGITQDGTGTNAIYIGKFYPRAFITDVGDQAWSDDAEALVYDVTITPQNDATIGTGGSPCVHFFGGPGWFAQLSQTGFSANPGGS